MTGTIGAVMPADRALALLDALASFAETLGRQCEIILRPDGSGSIMAAEEMAAPNDEEYGLDELARFDTLAELEQFLGGRP